MPEQSLNLLLKYNQARLDEECDCDGNADDQSLSKEAAFIDLAKTLAAHEQVISQLIPMLENPALTVKQKQMVFYLLLLGDEHGLKKQALEAHFSESETAFDLLPALALLADEQQAETLEQLAAINASTARKTLAGYFLMNAGGEKYSHLLLDSHTGKALDEGEVFDTFVACFGTSQAKQQLLSRFKGEQGDKKTALANALLFAESLDALHWLCSKEGMLKDYCQSFARLSSPAEYDNLDLLGNPAIDESTLLAIADALKWYGNPQSVSLLRQGTEHESPKVQQAFHRLLMAFFDDKDGAVFEGFLLLEDEAISQNNDTTRLKAFWTSKTITLTEQLSDQRYFQNQPFNIKALFKDYIGTRSPYDLSEHTSFSQFVRYLSLWTGHYFYYDEHALVSKQCQQTKVIKDWLDANAFEPGRFLCFERYRG